ncbi:MAG: hypothetical protein LC126_06805 [Bryobacterales bacterium]|nr:hypothetical protein [Bryobacterales bacterium]
MSDCPYGLEALRRFREQHGQVDGPAEPVRVEDDGEERVVPDDGDGDDFDDLFDAWVDFNMEASG